SDLRISNKQAYRLTDAPFYRMQAIAAIGNMRSPNIFVGRQDILHPSGDQRAQRNLKRQRTKVDVIVAFTTWMQVDMVVTDADTVVKVCRNVRGLSSNHGSIFRPDMLFKDGGERLDTARLPNIRIFSQAIRRSHNIRPQAQPRPSLSAIRSRCFGLQPV